MQTYSKQTILQLAFPSIYKYIMSSFVNKNTHTIWIVCEYPSQTIAYMYVTISLLIIEHIDFQFIINNVIISEKFCALIQLISQKIFPNPSVKGYEAV